MCESKVYIRRGDNEELIMEDVAHIRLGEEGLVLTNIYGKRALVKDAEILYIDFMRHKVVLRTKAAFSGGDDAPK